MVYMLCHRLGPVGKCLTYYFVLKYYFIVQVLKMFKLFQSISGSKYQLLAGLPVHIQTAKAIRDIRW